MWSDERRKVARETHLQVKMHKTHQRRTTFGSCGVEKVHTVVARSTFPSQNVQNTSASEHFWKLRCRKSACRCGAKHISKSKCAKHTILGPLLDRKCRCGAKHISKSKCTKHVSFGALLEVEASKKCTPLWREAHFEVKMYKARQLRSTFGSWGVEKVYAVVARSTFWSQKCKKLRVRSTFGRSDVGLRGSRRGLRTFSTVSKTWGSCSISKNDGRRGTFEEDLERYIFRRRRSTRDMFIRDVRRWGRWFPQRGCILEHEILRFAKMISRDRCSTSHDLASLFCGKRNTLDRWSRKITKRIGTRPSALHSTFHFWRRSLAELLRFWCCQLGKLRKSRRIAVFLMLSTSKTEEFSQNCSVFDVVKIKNWGSLAE